ncbi:E3 ubiquitin ligase BIG BROTHER-related-like [Solanum pennellii]|uniref:RING-type E3 ubiquitin transferase n=1 Tax=Solanum pennellii TaxID=28526 RepID=A0ABM1FR65_SOLPN|nr:E3 ubiquitin ligase BIG BROTHER-related-like [Solanum pennellii]
MSYSHSSPDYNQNSQFMFVNSRTSRRSPYDRFSRRRQHDHPFVLGLQATITPHSRGITIINVSSRDLVERALRQQHVADYYNGGSSQNSLDDSQPESELLFDDQETYTEEKKDDAGYFKTRIHRVADGVNNQIESKEICAICQAEFEHEESIGTLGCGHEYHTSCIKQWLLRKKDCPMCRASVLPLKHSI